MANGQSETLETLDPPPSPSPASVNPHVKALQVSGLGRVIPAQLEFQPAASLDVALYTPGASCMEFQPTMLTVPADGAVSAIVRHVLTDPDLALMGFDLSGYRVLQNAPSSEVTVDFRLPPQSARQWISLSMCEQQIVLGSVRKTLLENPVLAVKTVQFTERGQPLQL
jgi:hypothetical protein